MTRDPGHDAYPIPEFCTRHGFSRATYYNLPADQRPREMRVGARVLISREASAEWRRRMECLAAEGASKGGTKASTK